MDARAARRSLWVTTSGWRSPDRELHLLNRDGAWVGTLVIPARSTLLDAGPDWVLLLERGELGEHSVAVYELVEAGDSEPQRTPAAIPRASPKAATAPSVSGVTCL